MHIYVGLCEEPRLMLGVFLKCPPYSLRQCLDIEPRADLYGSLANQLPPESPSLDFKF